MDVLSPPLEEIDGAMYRVNSCDYPGSRSIAVYQEDEMDSVNGEYEENDDEMDPIFADMPVIEEIHNTRSYGLQFRIQFHVPKTLHGFLIGTKGQTRQRLELETRTKIMIPRRDEEGDIVVTGTKERNIKQCYSRIRMLIISSRKKLSPTHFVSIPLNTPEIRERFETFKNQVLECDTDNREILTQELFNLAEKLHLTLSVLTLLDEREREIACRRLDECQENVIEPILKNQAIAVKVRGIDIMNDDPTKVKVLYAKVESADETLQKLTDAVSAFFKRVGLTKDECDRDNVKLHVTLMNTTFLNRKDENSTNAPKRRNYAKFDASKILKNFQNFDFGVVMVNSLHLSQMHAYSEDGFYLSSNRIKWS